MGTTGFWHERTYFRVYRRKETLQNTHGWGGAKDVEELKISCFGRSTGEFNSQSANVTDLTVSRPHQESLEGR
jgi:chaperone BCS1